ncbi:hypothetical protein E4U61_003798 [Claviceps capensis]|nr:hypothetical protein E4U61_003798 [Claviceps capensis]
MASHSINEIDDDESHPIHPTLKTVEKYVSERWHDSDDTVLDLRTATQTDLNDQVICFLNQYLEDEIANNILRRRVCQDFQTWDKDTWNRVHKEVRTKFRNTLRDNGVHVAVLESVANGLAHMIQRGYQTSGETESEASFQSLISKGKQPANPLDKGNRTEALSNDQLDPNHPKNIGQQFDDSGNPVHTDKASSRTRAHRYYQTGQHDNIATAGPSGTHGVTGYNGVPAYGFPDPYWNAQRPYGRGPPNNPGRPGPSGPQGHSGYDAPFGPYGGGYNGPFGPYGGGCNGPFAPYGGGYNGPFGPCGGGYNGPFGPYGYPGNTAATNGPYPQHNHNYEPDTQTRQSRTDIEYEDRRFQRCQDTLIKAYTEKDKYTGAAGEFLMPKVTLFKHRCKRARATPDDWAELLSVILAGKALTWYMNTLEGNKLTFDDAVMAIHRTFETRSNYQGHFDRFSMMTIQMVMEKNPEKSLKDNFDILVADLETLFYGIYHPSLIDVTLFGRLRQAVAGIPEFKKALYTIDATPTYEGFLNNLRNALDAEQTSNPANQFKTSATPAYHPPTPFVTRAV